MATNTREEIDDLFSMFHDFEITNVIFENNTLDLTIIIPWGELWGDDDYTINVVLNGCEFIQCNYAEIINTPENLAKNSVDWVSINKSTNEPKIISEIKLLVQSHNFYAPNKYELLCNSSKNQKYAGGQLIFTADNYGIFIEDKTPIEITQMMKWGKEWWDKIEKQ